MSVIEENITELSNGNEKKLSLEKFGNEIIAKFLMQVFRFNKMNKMLELNSNHSGIDFIDAIFEKFQIKFEFNEEDLKRIPVNGAFITVSNHPLGGIDGLLLLKLITKVRPDYKILANFLLQRIEPLKEYIFPHNPDEKSKYKEHTFSGLQYVLEHLQDKKACGIFPAGDVSVYQTDRNKVSDKEWNPAVISFLKKAEVPIVPVYFQGRNSRLFHILATLHPLVRAASLPSEMFNKKHKVIKIKIGHPISVKEQAEIEDIDTFGRFLRAKTYALGTTIEIKKFFSTPFIYRAKKVEPIIEPVPKAELTAEVDRLIADYMLVRQGNFVVFCAPTTEMPLTHTEIGRLREQTFREVGEGTNKSIDIDEFDLYYNQLVIWDADACSIVGGYRIGKGKDIINQYGVKGFYIHTLFKISEGFTSVMKESIELGRSFIVKEYQRKPMSLFMLWKGILYFLLKNAEYRYMIGPVSISNEFSKFSKELIVEFLRNNFFNHEFAKYIRPRKQFKVKKDKNFDKEVMFSSAKNDIQKLDNFIKDYETGLRTPVLIKKYLQLNAKIVSFNIDPKFNDCLDGLIVLDIFDIPYSFLKTFSKELNDASILERFNPEEEAVNIVEMKI